MIYVIDFAQLLFYENLILWCNEILFRVVDGAFWDTYEVKVQPVSFSARKNSNQFGEMMSI